MTLAAARVALRKLRAELREDSAAAAGGNGLVVVVLASATTSALHLGELLLPVRVRQEFSNNFLATFAFIRLIPAAGVVEKLVANRSDFRSRRRLVRPARSCVRSVWARSDFDSSSPPCGRVQTRLVPEHVAESKPPS